MTNVFDLSVHNGRVTEFWWHWHIHRHKNLLLRHGPRILSKTLGFAGHPQCFAIHFQFVLRMNLIFCKLKVRFEKFTIAMEKNCTMNKYSIFSSCLKRNVFDRFTDCTIYVHYILWVGLEDCRPSDCMVVKLCQLYPPLFLNSSSVLNSKIKWSFWFCTCSM